MKKTLLSLSITAAVGVSATAGAFYYEPIGPLISNSFPVSIMIPASTDTSPEGIATVLDYSDCTEPVIFVDRLRYEGLYGAVPQAQAVCRVPFLPMNIERQLKDNGVFRLANASDGEGGGVHDSVCTVIANGVPYYTFDWTADYRKSTAPRHEDGVFEVELNCYDAFPEDVD